MIAIAIEKHVDLDLLIKISSSAEALPETRYKINTKTKPMTLKVGIAKDAAFGFYYPSDLNAFKTEGVELIEFDTLNDKKATIRDRDTLKQERVDIEKIGEWIKEKLK